MKYSLQFLLLFLVAAFPTSHFASIAIAQDEVEGVELILEDDREDEDIDRDEDEDHEGGIRIMINGKELEIDEEQIESFIEESGEEIEAWAERHADAWESWAEKFEAKMGVGGAVFRTLGKVGRKTGSRRNQRRRTRTVDGKQS